MSEANADELVVNFLDMGSIKYGDAVLVRGGGHTVLIDGGHPEDFTGQDRTPSIPEQLEAILGPRPFPIDLLVVTHVHNDHIGCLPEMVEAEMLRPTWALVADERIGFGRSEGDAADAMPDADLPAPLRALIAAGAEEDYSDLPDAELERVLLDFVKVEPRYKAMLRQLRDGGTKVVRYGRDSARPLVEAFQGVGLKILGPTREHLALCAEATRRAEEANRRRVRSRRREDAASLASDTAGLASLYRQLQRAHVLTGADTDPLADFVRDGKNNTSIVLRFELPGSGRATMLAGDMQFALPLVDELDDDMERLRQRVKAAGPYELVKTTHHTSHNGINAHVMGDYPGTVFYVHTGGSNDATHPHPDALADLKERSREIQFARTDRNGLITVRMGPDGTTLETSKGRVNDFTENSDVAPAAAGAAIVRASPGAQSGSAERPATEPEVWQRAAGDRVEVLARIPHSSTRVTIAVDIEPRGTGPRGETGREPEERPAAGPATKGAAPVGGSSRSEPLQPSPPTSAPRSDARSLPPLLYVTEAGQLRRNIGEREAERVLNLLRSAGGELLVLNGRPRHAKEAWQQVGPRLRGNIKGVVIVGGYDVVPPARLDAIGPQLRARVDQLYARNPRMGRDPDRFRVWSDDIYGCSDGDGLPELPVSRIPDGKSPEFTLRALRAAAPAAAGAAKFSVRNCERPFADVVFGGIKGDGRIESCEKFGSAELKPEMLRVSRLYLMLHGYDTDGRRFTGEGAEGYPVAVHVRNVGSCPGAVVLAGCCYGAFCGEELAFEDGAVSGRQVDASLALTFLENGANAFVGCTGVHYSPPVEPDHFGGPMHTAFWQAVDGGAPPAPALLEAKKAYIRGMPHGDRSPVHLAIEKKILAQFTCLGLGW